MTRPTRVRTLTILLLAIVIAGAIGFAWYMLRTPRSGHILDEALSASPRREAESFPAADEDVAVGQEGVLPVASLRARS